MGDHREIICIVCPKGCHSEAWEQDEVVHIKGDLCKKGKPYIEQEYRDPRRILTSTVVVESGCVKRLPVRSSAAIPKGDLLKSVALVSKIKVKPPVRIGNVIIENISPGVDVIASDDLLE